MLKSLVLSIGSLILTATLSAPTRAADPDWAVAWKGAKRPKPPYTRVFADKELADYMGKVLGVKVPTAQWPNVKAENVFVIMEAADAPADVAKALEGKRRDAFVIKYPYTLDGRKVCLLVSHDVYGCDYPGYYFLNRFMDVHWVGPGEIGEVYAVKRDWKMPAKTDVLANPDFEQRLWGDMTFKMCRPILAGSSRLGFHHALGRIFDPKKYGKTDPDVYPLIDGKRYVPSPSQGHYLSGWQPCVGNPRSVDIAVRHVLDTYKRSPRTASVSLSVNDGGGNHCQCKLCRAMDAKDAFKDPMIPKLSDRYFRFYNKVIERVVKAKPDAYVAALGYGACSRPPVETKIHPRVIVFVTGGDPTRFKGVGGARGSYFYCLDNAYPTVRHYLGIIRVNLVEADPSNEFAVFVAQIEVRDVGEPAIDNLLTARGVEHDIAVWDVNPLKIGGARAVG